MHINTLLLSIFARDIKLGVNIESARLRYHTLISIYVTVLIGACALIYTTAQSILESSHHPLRVSVLYFLYLASSPTVFRRATNTSTVITSLWAFVLHILATNFGNEPLVGFLSLLSVVVINSFLTSSAKVYGVTVVLSIPVYIFYAKRTYDIFYMNLNDQQSRHILNAVVTAAAVLMAIVALLMVQKIMEKKVWDLSNANYLRSEILTEEAIQASQAKDIFVSSLSHEIRNPLNLLKGSIDYLLEVVRNVEHLRILGNAKLSCEMLLNLANNVLDAAKLRADKMEISRSEADLTEVFRKAFLINSEVLKANKIQVEAFFDRNLPRTIWADPSRLLQVIMNLISNALKFTPAGGKITTHVTWHPLETNIETLLQPTDNMMSLGVNPLDPRPVVPDDNSRGLTNLASTCEFNLEESLVRSRNLHHPRHFETKPLGEIDSLIHSSSELEPWRFVRYNPHLIRQDVPQDKGYLKIQVSDTGCGIAQEHIPRLFQMFAQAHRSVINMHGGTGLGLWICKQICTKMGGDIKLYSQQQRGTTFVFYLPINNDRISLSPLPRPHSTQGICNVLIVDDYNYNRDLHKLIVEREGGGAIIASNGLEAIDKFKAREEGYYSFIMMDVKMPQMTGFEAVKKIQAWENEQNRQKRVDIYFVSGEYFDEDQIRMAYRGAGVTGDASKLKYMRKPVELLTVRGLVEKYKRSE